MVVALGPGKFYGSTLPRPRMMLMNRPEEEEDIYMNARVDPPLGVMDPLLTWAHEAHWSMGGLSFNRLKLQGKIEGNVKKLRSQQKKKLQAIKNSPVRVSDLHHSSSSSPSSASPSPPPSPPPPPAPVATKRRRRLAHLLDDNNESSDGDVFGIDGSSKTKRASKLVDDFDRVASSESESSANTIQSSLSSLVLSPNTKKNQSVTREGRTLSSRTRSVRKISPEKEASKKKSKNISMATPSPPTEVRTSRRLRSSLTV